MKEIPLTQGQVAIVDDDVYEWVSLFKWHAKRRANAPGFYAARNSPQDPTTGKQKTILLHREIMKPGFGEQVDHKFGNTLDNRRSEMRNVTNTENTQAFSQPKENRSSKFRGVDRTKRDKMWRARIQAGGRSIHLGGFESETDAARAYDKAALELFGEFAQPNFPTCPS